jgi:hypothetical protein
MTDFGGEEGRMTIFHRVANMTHILESIERREPGHYTVTKKDTEALNEVRDLASLAVQLSEALTVHHRGFTAGKCPLCQVAVHAG